MAEIVHEVRLHKAIESGALGGPGFLTKIVPLESGREKRTPTWQDFLGAWDISYGLMDMEPVEAFPYIQLIQSFFIARNGRAFSFLFEDPFDYAITRLQIGVTDGATAAFQMFQRYEPGPYQVDKTVVRPVPETVSVWVDGVLIQPGPGAGQYLLDPLTGIVTVGSALAALTATAVEVAGDYLKVVRFDIDHLNISLRKLKKAGSIPSMPIQEVVP